MAVGKGEYIRVFASILTAIILDVSHTLSQLIFRSSPWKRHCNYPYFTEKETEAPKL